MRSFTFSVVAVLVLAVGCGDVKKSKTVDASSQSDAAAIDAPAVALTCASYCSKIATNCTGANQQYSDVSNCMASCALMTPGVAAEMTGNTLGCRTYHADAAAAGPGVHCRHAGPGGDGVCGANCDGFCTIAVGACTAQATQPYASKAACMTACAGFATTPVYSSSVTSGNSLACRMYHAVVATTIPSPHCTHVTPTSATCQ